MFQEEKLKLLKENFQKKLQINDDKNKSEDDRDLKNGSK